MPRSPLFREENKTLQSHHPIEGATSPQVTVKQVTKKGGKNDAIWNRMNAAMRLSCQPPSKPPIK